MPADGGTGLAARDIRRRLNSVRRDVKGPGEHEGDRKTGEQTHDHETQGPNRQVPSRKNRGRELDDAGGDDVSDRGAVNLAPLSSSKNETICGSTSFPEGTAAQVSPARSIARLSLSRQASGIADREEPLSREDFPKG